MHYDELIDAYFGQVSSSSGGDHTDNYFEYTEYTEGSDVDFTSTHDAGGHQDEWEEEPEESSEDSGWW